MTEELMRLLIKGSKQGAFAVALFIKITLDFKYLSGFLTSLGSTKADVLYKAQLLLALIKVELLEMFKLCWNKCLHPSLSFLLVV